ncbi:2-amino-4-hydroxy-6-hydroxymethyldihydropteridine diphosphokinase [Bacillus thuringiensis]|jgi:2-amino-4-hydroxy-6-hydroxymethyldihydropteridine diphosphokinase|uniref:2-amino-4-hydroxy-6-hydroxymethyldihydropteridine diphosphokinase n=19 Tax=Bacillaceae TaxID=186817 RepID=A0A9Q7J8J5_BACTU|nr:MULTISPECIES: 2-amino-4-hydroxy-6-hydroxymethyldihydropteridine diphosphokinase [Bacillus]EAO53583.1 2-amino-4-hydroxy-6-hydroxymethyldihydropteridine pyrophosphokinase [Bacillus thuringiensis serovar israelensis ATCC 35646]MBJ6721895.1 2-amino-4-hydroxy-6-hydroxymethyldihydropteridine diphosphokinase [Bacillus sp. PR5]MCO4217714.1 2-amino-4-hydroxy-6-hydroxymethyldihydropteridine diphosphokinase [Bacillus sp. 10017]MCX2704816.1 2-amino-4-hydroxy-6-hydroxymethyldihydropteridine diphosphokina
MNNIAYIALGSNIGERYTYLTEAIQFLNKNPYIQVDDISSVYETEPVGYTDQSCFLNLVIKISTNLSPQELLKVTQKVENDLGRKREIRWGPRTIDLDILLYNQENIEAENLIVPHPRMFERAFVIVPLLEINQDIKQNISRSQVEEMKRREGVTVWKQKNGEDAFVLFES